MISKDEWNNKWNAQDEKCPACGQVTKIARGINKQNLNKLIFQKPTMQDWIILFMLVCVLLLAWRYNVETEQARYSMSHMDETCMKYKVTYIQANNSQDNNINLLKLQGDLNLTSVNNNGQEEQ